MIKLYDHLDELLEDNHKRNVNALRYLASELMDDLGYNNEIDLRNAMLRAFEVCCTLRIPISDNFRKVYRFNNDSVVVDWQVSDLGCYLLLINGNSCNPNVAKAQIQALIFNSKKA